MDPGPAFIEFYVSLVTYTMMHMIFVISSDFVDAFNIPPLNIGIYVDKLAAIRALLMVIADILEWAITQKGCGDGANANQSLMKQTSATDQEWFTRWELRSKEGSNSYEKWNYDPKGAGGARRWASILSFLAMLACRIAYLRLVYYSDNKSLSVFIVLCVEGFWFGVFQMGFFAIGPEYNALTSLGIHTMGNFIFFFQLILNKFSNKYPSINSLYRVRVHGWVCVTTSIIALILWLCFCLWVTAAGDDVPSDWPDEHDVWSPFWLFIVGAFAEDFSVPGILPFAFLDPDKAALVNYLTPVFFMTGALMTVLVNDVFTGKKGLGKDLHQGSLTDLGFKDWSAASYASMGKSWHAVWLLNLPKYIAFFISMWCIHGTYGRLRCIVQCRWRVMLLTMTVVIPRATLETMGYVGVANWAIGRGDSKLAVQASLVEGLKTQLSSLTASQIKDALNGVPVTLARVIETEFGGAKVKGIKEKQMNKYDIEVKEEDDNANKVTVVFENGGVNVTGNGMSEEIHGMTGSKGVKVRIKIKSAGSLKRDSGSNDDEATALAGKIKIAVEKAHKLAKEGDTGMDKSRRQKGADYDGFTMIAVHDMVAMFCRFVYGKFAVKYKYTQVSLGIYYCLDIFIYYF